MRTKKCSIHRYKNEKKTSLVACLCERKYSYGFRYTKEDILSLAQSLW